MRITVDKFNDCEKIKLSFQSDSFLIHAHYLSIGLLKVFLRNFHRLHSPFIARRNRFITSGKTLRDICNPTRCRRLHCVLQYKFVSSPLLVPPTRLRKVRRRAGEKVRAIKDAGKETGAARRPGEIGLVKVD